MTDVPVSVHRVDLFHRADLFRRADGPISMAGVSMCMRRAARLLSSMPPSVDRHRMSMVHSNRQL